MLEATSAPDSPGELDEWKIPETEEMAQANRMRMFLCDTRLSPESRVLAAHMEYHDWNEWMDPDQIAAFLGVGKRELVLFLAEITHKVADKTGFWLRRL